MARRRMPRIKRRKIRIKIQTTSDLAELERIIRAQLQALPLDGVLWTLFAEGKAFEPFVVAGFVAFALESCTPSSGDVRPVALSELQRLAPLVTNYLLADPIVFDDELRQKFYKENPIFLLIRISASQHPYHVNVFETYGRPLILFQEIPARIAGKPGVPDFDLESAFRTISGVGLVDFVQTGVLTYIIAKKLVGFSSSVFESWKSKGVLMPSLPDIRKIMLQLTADQHTFLSVQADHAVPDERFRMYALNPLFKYPIIRPWGHEPFWSARGGRMIAPMPELVIQRISFGIYHQLLTHFGLEFTQYFGHVFSEYCGMLLESAVGASNLMSENQIRNHFPQSKGKVPDWVVIDGDVAVLVECKATRFSRAALSLASEEAVNQSLKQIVKGLAQLAQFAENARTGAVPIEELRTASTWVPVLLTLEPIPGVRIEFFREHINSRLLEEHGITGLDWQVVAMEELELIERYVRRGISLAEAFSQSPTADVIRSYEDRTGNLTNADSFLLRMHNQIFEMFGADITPEDDAFDGAPNRDES